MHSKLSIRYMAEGYTYVISVTDNDLAFPWEDKRALKE
jgi:hypothetical protein